MIKGYRENFPVIDRNSYVDESAVIIGSVKIGRYSSVWPGVVLRGDIDLIEIKERSNIQDGTVAHTSPGCPVVIGSGVTVGHGAILHGTTVSDNVLIGMGAILLDGSAVEKETIVAAGSLVPEGMTLCSGWLYMGIPAIKKRRLKSSDKDILEKRSREYMELAELI